MPCPEKFRDSLVNFKVDEKIIGAVNDGYEDLVSKSPKKIKAEYFQRATDILSESLSHDTLKEIYEWNACCKSGSREKASKAFAKENAELTLDERLKKIKDVRFMGVPRRNSDGTITVDAVSFFDGERFKCACSNFNASKPDFNVSKNYCFCCAGHFKYHYEIMLGVKLNTVEIISSPLDSCGKNPCVIKFEVKNT